MPLSPKDQEQIRNLGLLCGIAVAFFVAAPLPDQGIGILQLNKMVKSTTRQLEAKRTELREKQDKIDMIPALQAELDEREPDIRKYEARLPKSKKTPELFRDIDRFKQAANLQITMQTRLDPVDRSDYVELSVRIEALGSYDSIARFINQVENSQRFAQVKTLRITEKPESGGSSGAVPAYDVHEVVMVISSFMFKDQVVSEEEI